MSLLKKLQIGDNHAGRYTKEYLLTDYKCFTSRRHNEYRPEAERYCDRIELTVIAPGREDMSLYEWFINQTTLNGRVYIDLPPQADTSVGNVREIRFEEALCFSFEEEYHIGENQRRVLKLSVIANQVDINGVIFTRNI